MVTYDGVTSGGGVWGAAYCMCMLSSLFLTLPCIVPKHHSSGLSLKCHLAILRYRYLRKERGCYNHIEIYQGRG